MVALVKMQLEQKLNRRIDIQKNGLKIKS